MLKEKAMRIISFEPCFLTHTPVVAISGWQRRHAGNISTISLTFCHVIRSINHNMTKRCNLSLDKDIRDRIENLCRLISFLSWALKPLSTLNISPLQILKQNFYCFVY